MTENDPYKDDIRLKNEKSFWGLIAKIIFCICAFVVVILTVMANMGGNNEMLKSGVTQFVSRIFNNRPATLDRLVNMRFFPSVGVDFEGLHVQPFVGSSENLVNIGKFKFYSSFWNIIMGQQKFKGIYATDIFIKEGVWGDRSVTAESIVVNHDVSTGEAELRASGKLAYYDWSLVAELQVEGFAGDYQFSFANEVPFKMDIGDVQITGTVVHYDGDFVTLKNLLIKRKEQQITGELSLSVIGELALKIKGSLKVNNSDGAVVIDLDLKHSAEGKPKISGEIKGISLTEKDLTGDQSLFVFLGRILEVSALNNLPFPILTVFDFAQHYDLDVNVDLKAYRTQKTKDNEIVFSVLKTSEYARISKVKGILDGVSLDVPDLYFMAQDANMFALLQGGQFNPQLISHISNVLPIDFVNASKPFNITCGLASFEKKGTGYSLNGISLDSAQGKKEQGVKQQSLTLSSRVYDFVNTSLLAAAQDNPCQAYISKKDEQEKKNASVEKTAQPSEEKKIKSE